MRTLIFLLVIVIMPIVGITFWEPGESEESVPANEAGGGVMTPISNSGPAPQEGGEDLVENPVELGRVNWGRDLNLAVRRSKETGKPIFLLFQEIPGCATCQGFGTSPLSHPLMVEAIEDLFIPVVVHNNRVGPDAEILKEFNEPSWNNPVVRFIDANKKDIIPRKDRVWNIEGVASRMVESLEQASRPVPEFLKQLVRPAELSTATFAMHCFWEGEAKLGGIDGVVDTRSAWKDNLEVVQVNYDPDVVGYRRLLQAAQQFECATKVFAHDEEQFELAKELVGERAVRSDEKVRLAKLSDQKYFLRHSVYKSLPLTKFQATKVNSVLGRATDRGSASKIKPLLSPRQQKQLQRISDLLKSQLQSFEDCVWPDDDEQLDAYQQKLNQFLKTK